MSGPGLRLLCALFLAALGAAALPAASGSAENDVLGEWHVSIVSPYFPDNPADCLLAVEELEGGGIGSPMACASGYGAALLTGSADKDARTFLLQGAHAFGAGVGISGAVSEAGETLGATFVVATVPPPYNTGELTGTRSDDLWGDIDCSDATNAIDLAVLLQFAAHLALTPRCLGFGDVNGSGTVDLKDAALIAQREAGLVATLPLIDQYPPPVKPR